MTKIGRHGFILILLLIFCFFSNAQTELSVTWSKEMVIERSGAPNIPSPERISSTFVGTLNGHVICHDWENVYEFDGVNLVAKGDKHGDFKRGNKEFFIQNNKLYVVYNEWKNKAGNLYLAEYSISEGKKIGTPILIYNNEKEHGFTPEIERNGNFIMIKLYPDYSNITYRYILLDSDLQIIENKKLLNYEDALKNINTSEVFLLEKGQIVHLLKQDKAPLQLGIHEEGDFQAIHFESTKDKVFIGFPVFKSLKNGEIKFNWTYRHKDAETKIYNYGIALFKMTSSGKVSAPIFSDYFKSAKDETVDFSREISGKGTYSENGYKMMTRKWYWNDNQSSYIGLSEEQIFSSITRSSGSTSELQISRYIYVYKLDSDGEMAWHLRIPKLQDIGGYNSFSSFITKQNLYVFFNDNVKNYTLNGEFISEKNRQVNNSSKNSTNGMIACAKIDLETGEMRMNRLSKQELSKVIFVASNHFIDSLNNRLYFLGLKPGISGKGKIGMLAFD